MVLLLALLSMVIEPSGLMTVLSVSLSSEIVYVSLLLWDMVVKEENLDEVKSRVTALCEKYPLYK